MWKVELSSFQNVLLESPLMLVSKVTDVQRLYEIKKNIRIILLFSFILQFHPLQYVIYDGFSQITSQMLSWTMFVCLFCVMSRNVSRKFCGGRG